MEGSVAICQLHVCRLVNIYNEWILVFIGFDAHLSCKMKFYNSLVLGINA